VQIVFLVVLIALGALFVVNTTAGLERAGIVSNFSWLDDRSAFRIDEGLVERPHSIDDDYAHAFVVGFVNTMRVVFIGLILATLLGLFFGIARLSTNWLLRVISLVFIEVMQNTPLLVQLVFIYAGVVLTLPMIREAIVLPGPSYLSIRGYASPALVPTESTPLWMLIMAGTFAVTYALWQIRRRTQIETGKVTYAAETALGLFALVAVIATVVLRPYLVDVPTVQGPRYIGGAVVSPEFVAIVVGLVLYTGAFIAEIVRSGIQAVPHGQWEAARASGFTYAQTLRLIILPQALRVMIAKNSTLGAVGGYQELFGVGKTAQESVPVIPVLVIVMGTYLAISLLTALIMNRFNARMQLKTR
jgi:general L-amino acid transport system permease protein